MSIKITNPENPHDVIDVYQDSKSVGAVFHRVDGWVACYRRGGDDLPASFGEPHPNEESAIGEILDNVCGLSPTCRDFLLLSWLQAEQGQPFVQVAA